MEQIKPEYKETIITIIKKHLPVCKIYLFGSRAKSTQDTQSDIDIALETKSEIDGYTMSLIKEEIEESTIPFFVDVVDFNTASKNLQKQILKERIEWTNYTTNTKTS